MSNAESEAGNIGVAIAGLIIGLIMLTALLSGIGILWLSQEILLNSQTQHVPIFLALVVVFMISSWIADRFLNPRGLPNT
jgi:hypothetical protein